MPRVNETLFYPEGPLFIRRTPGAPKTWQVCQGTVTGKGKTRTLVVERILSLEIALGKHAREQARQFAEMLGLNEKPAAGETAAA